MCYGTIILYLSSIILLLFFLCVLIMSIFIKFNHFAIVICFYDKFIFWSIGQSSSMLRTNKRSRHLAVWFVTDLGLLFISDCLLLDGMLFLDACFSRPCSFLIDLDIDDLVHYWIRNAFITSEACLCMLYAWFFVAFLQYRSIVPVGFSAQIVYNDFRIVKLSAEYSIWLILLREFNSCTFQSL